MEIDALCARLQTCPHAKQKGSQWSEPGQQTYVKCWRSGITALLFQRFTSMKKGMGYLYFEKLNSGPFLNYRLLCWSLRKSRVTPYGAPEIKAFLLHDQGACIFYNEYILLIQTNSKLWGMGSSWLKDQWLHAGSGGKAGAPTGGPRRGSPDLQTESQPWKDHRQSRLPSRLSRQTTMSHRAQAGPTEEGRKQWDFTICGDLSTDWNPFKLLLNSIPFMLAKMVRMLTV